MALNKRQIQQIKSALHNTLDKVKAHIRKTGEIPPAKTAFEWFQHISEIEIIQNKPSIDASNIDENLFESMFFFNDLQVHLHLTFEYAQYRGRPYFDATFNYTFINELDIDDYFDEQTIEYLKNKFNLIFFEP